MHDIINHAYIYIYVPPSFLAPLMSCIGIQESCGSSLLINLFSPSIHDHISWLVSYSGAYLYGFKFLIWYECSLLLEFILEI
jgi:hypothetical protein